MRSTLSKAAFASMTLLLLHGAAGAADKAGYRVVKKVTIGGPGVWDYLTLDPTSKLLYVTHGDRVDVLDVQGGKLEAPLGGMRGVHGVAVAPEANRGYATNSTGNSLTVFDLKARKKLAELKTGTSPDGVLYDPFSRRVFAFNGRSKDVTAVAVDGDQAVGTLALGGKPERAVSDGRGTIFVNVEATSEVVAFDAKQLRIKSRWKASPCDEPTGLAMDEKGRRLFAVCGNSLMVVLNADTGAVVASLPIGAGSDGVKYDPGSRLIFSSNGEGTMTVIEQLGPDQYRVDETVATARGARTLDIDPATHHVFVSTVEFAAAKGQKSRAPAVVPESFMVIELGR